jgi:hypothetical protein
VFEALVAVFNVMSADNVASINHHGRDYTWSCILLYYMLRSSKSPAAVEMGELHSTLPQKGFHDRANALVYALVSSTSLPFSKVLLFFLLFHLYLCIFCSFPVLGVICFLARFVIPAFRARCIRLKWGGESAKVSTGDYTALGMCVTSHASKHGIRLTCLYSRRDNRQKRWLSS